jgi:hypothetical protein
MDGILIERNWRIKKAKINILQMGLYIARWCGRNPISWGFPGDRSSSFRQYLKSTMALSDKMPPIN